MFPQLKKINNESGIVLFMVLMVSMIIMIFSLGVLTQSLNESNYAQQQIDQIASQELSKGLFWNAYASNMSAASTQQSSQAETGRTYTGIFAKINNASDNTWVQIYNVTANYDTYQ